MTTACALPTMYSRGFQLDEGEDAIGFMESRCDRAIPSRDSCNTPWPRMAICFCVDALTEKKCSRPGVTS